MKRIWAAGVVVAVAVAAQMVLADPYQELVRYKFGDSRAALVAIEEEMRAAKPSAYPAIEAKLLKVLQSPEATEDAKSFVCRCLRQIGSAKCVPAVAPLLTHEKLSHMARYALQGNPSREAGKALRDALGAVKGNLLIGVISSVAARRDVEAVGALESLARSDDAAVAAAAMSGLGQIGGPKAVAALQAITPPASLQKAWASACLSCAESLPKSEAGRIYRRIFDGPYDIVSRAAALAGLVRTGQMKAGELVAVLKGKEPQLQVAAAQLSSELREKAAVQGYVAALPALPAHLQVIVISGFAASKNRAAATAAAALAESADAEVVTAALRALGEIGDASHVPMLMRLALGKDERAALAFASLTRLPGAAVDAALAKSLRSSDARERVRAIEAFAARMDRRQNKAILAACKDADKDVRIAAYKALRSLADDSMLPALADLLIATDSGAERGELEQTVTATALRAASADAAAEVLIARLGRSVETDAILLGVLAKRGGSKALAEVRRRVGSNDPEQRKAAVRAMSAWADTAPLGDLMNVAQNDPDAACRTLALRGYVRLVADSNLSVDEKVKMFQSALEAAKQPDAIKQILAGLGGLKELASLKVVMGQLDNAAVASEAAAAALSISQELVTRRKLRDKAVADALMQIQKNQTVSEAQRKQAASLLKRMSQSESKSK